MILGIANLLCIANFRHWQLIVQISWQLVLAKSRRSKEKVWFPAFVVSRENTALVKVLKETPQQDFLPGK